MSVQLPSPQNRTVIVGSTGTGKTQAGVWLLSTRNWRVRPWVIFDFKGDALIAEIGAKEISIRGKVPTKPGIYVVRPIPYADDDAINEFLFKIWAQTNVGVYIDEGYMIPKRSAAFSALLTQGRSKNIEMITLSQRPVWMDKFVFTEAEFMGVFALNSHDDRKFLSQMTGADLKEDLPKYCFLWYDVSNRHIVKMLPVPNRKELINTFVGRKPKIRAV